MATKKELKWVKLPKYSDNYSFRIYDGEKEIIFSLSGFAFHKVSKEDLMEMMVSETIIAVNRLKRDSPKPKGFWKRRLRR